VILKDYFTHELNNPRINGRKAKELRRESEWSLHS